jgi:hypothetical protein
MESQRTAQVVLLGRLPLRLGGQTHVLPVLTTGQNAEWQSRLDDSVRPLLPDDATPVALLEAMGAIDLLGFIYSYDINGVLPPREKLEPDVYPHELLWAVQEVRLAANPTVAYAVALTLDEARELFTKPRATEPASAPPPNRAQRRSARTSSRQPRTAGPTARSGTS